MNLNDIKVGDKVIVRIVIRTEWNRRKYFNVVKKVTRVSEKEFLTEDNTRFFKRSGAKVGDSVTRAKVFNDPSQDETKAMNLFLKKCRIVRKLKNKAAYLFEKISEAELVDLPVEVLDVFNTLLAKLTFYTNQ